MKTSTLKIVAVAAGMVLLLLIGGLVGGYFYLDSRLKSGPPPKPMEEARQLTAWDLEVLTVARELDLAPDQIEAATRVYKDARARHQEALRTIMEETGGGLKAMGRMREVSKLERDQLHERLKGVMPEPQADLAIASLGTLSHEWDRMADVLNDYGLTEENLFKALASIRTYVVEASAAMSKAMESFNFMSMRPIYAELRGKLDGEISVILSAEQFDHWLEATTPKPRPGQNSPPAQATPSPGH
jgi:hypothetical protein